MLMDIENYLVDFINNYKGNKEKLILDIMLGKNVKGLDEYSKYILLLVMEKLIVERMEMLHLKINNTSMWAQIKDKAPNVFFDSKDIKPFINSYLKNYDKPIDNSIDTIKQINVFYAKKVLATSKLEANRMVELPSGAKTSMAELNKKIVELFDKKKETYNITKTSYRAKKAVITAGIIAAVASTMVFASKSKRQEQPSQIEEDYDSSIENDSMDLVTIEIGDEFNNEANNEIDFDNKLYVPQEMQAGISTNYTPYDIDWDETTPQYVLNQRWKNKNKSNDRGIATIDGRYLVATTPIFGDVGDSIDVVLTDGHIIPCIIADIKDEGAYNKWGHMIGNGVKDIGIDIIEWQGLYKQEDIDISAWKGNKVSYVRNITNPYNKGVENKNVR